MDRLVLIAVAAGLSLALARFVVLLIRSIALLVFGAIAVFSNDEVRRAQAIRVLELFYERTDPPPPDRAIDP